MDDGGWVRLHRQVLKSAVWENPNILMVWVWCLLQANWEETGTIFHGNELRLKRGQFTTSRKKGSEACCMSQSTFWWCIKKLEMFGNLNIQTDRHKTVITIVKYERYQGGPENLDNDADNRLTTDGQQVDNRGVSSNDIRKKEGKKETQVVFPPPLDNDAFKASWQEWVVYRAESRHVLKPTTIKKQLEFLAKQPDPIRVINQSIQNSWTGLFPVKDSNVRTQANRGTPAPGSQAARASFEHTEKDVERFEDAGEHYGALIERRRECPRPDTK
jgi:hypothetical protein